MKSINQLGGLSFSFYFKKNLLKQREIDSRSQLFRKKEKYSRLDRLMATPNSLDSDKFAGAAMFPEIISWVSSQYEQCFLDLNQWLEQHKVGMLARCVRQKFE